VIRFANLFLLCATAFVVGCDPPDVVKPPVEIPSVVVAEAPQSDTAISAATVSDFEASPALAAFLPKFDELKAKGFVPTLRKGSTGIGYTLETMLGIEENNSPGGDFMGMELKAWRDDGTQSERYEKMNLFLKEPKWVDGLKSADRVRNYGYVDPNGRTALYSTVKIETNSHQLGFSIDAEGEKLWLTFAGKQVAWWSFEVLAKRLKEKHTETVFVSAKVRGQKASEEFHYQEVLWCREPSVNEFLVLLQEGDAMLELRMHLKETGSVRNHGSCFRLRKDRLKDLFKYSTKVRTSEP